MEEGFSRREDVHPHLLQLYHNHKHVNTTTPTISEVKKLELRLAPPGDDHDQEDTYTHCNNIPKNKFQEKHHDPSLLSLGNSSFTNTNHTTCAGSKRGLDNYCWLNESQTHKFSSNLDDKNTSSWSSSASQYYHDHHQEDLLSVMGNELSPKCCSKGMVAELKNTQKQDAFLPDACAVNKTDAPNTSQKRTSPAPVVGWPPIRSFRKNIASNTSSMPKVEPKKQNVAPPEKNASKKQTDSCYKGLFVKINMEGVAIGRKVDLKAYDSYAKLSCSVDELFRGLLAAQRDPTDDKIQENDEGYKSITGLLDGRGEYTLVYEDNEGDRMLVGDVPWHMFVDTVKRLRVLKSSELSKSLFLGGSKQVKNPS